MNQTLPPGDRGHRSSALGWAPGRRGIMPRAVRLVWGIEAEAEEDAAESTTARRGRSRAGGRGGIYFRGSVISHARQQVPSTPRAQSL